MTLVGGSGEFKAPGRIPRKTVLLVARTGSIPFLARATGKAKSQAWIANATEGRGPG